MQYFLILIGIFNFFLSYKTRTDDKFRENYIKKSAKAWLWRKLFGEDKAIKLLKNVFAPLGMLLGILFILLGIFFMFL